MGALLYEECSKRRKEYRIGAIKSAKTFAKEFKTENASCIALLLESLGDLFGEQTQHKGISGPSAGRDADAEAAYEVKMVICPGPAETPCPFNFGAAPPAPLGRLRLHPPSTHPPSIHPSIHRTLQLWGRLARTLAGLPCCMRRASSHERSLTKCIGTLDIQEEKGREELRALALDTINEAWVPSACTGGQTTMVASWVVPSLKHGGLAERAAAVDVVSSLAGDAGGGLGGMACDVLDCLVQVMTTPGTHYR